MSFSELLSWGQRRQRGRYCPLRQRGSFRIPRQLHERFAGSRLARVFFAGDAEKKAEEYMANGSYTGPLAIIGVLKLLKHPDLQFRVLLTEGGSELKLARAQRK